MIFLALQGNYGKGNFGLGNVGFGNSIQDPAKRTAHRFARCMLV